MANSVKFKISPAVAAFVRPGVTVEKKLSGIQEASRMEPFEQVILLFCLMKDADSAVKDAAGSAFSSLPVEVALSYIRASEAHPSLLSELARIYNGNPDVTKALLGSESLSVQGRELLQKHQASLPVQTESNSPPEYGEESDDESQAEGAASPGADLPFAAEEMQDEELPEIAVDDEQYISKYKIAMLMGIGEKIKMALTGDKEWRSILIKDTNKLVSGSVVKNPRITDGEILTILKVGVQNDEIIRLICANKEWVKNYMIRKALVNCPKTPLPNALRYLATLNEKDIAGYAKSKNISSVISTQAKRMILSKKR